MPHPLVASTPVFLIAVPLQSSCVREPRRLWLFGVDLSWLGFGLGHAMQFWFIVGAVLPGLLGIGLVPKIVGSECEEVASSTLAGDSVKA